MTTGTPCTRHDRSGTDDPLLREVLIETGARAGGDLGDSVRALYDYDGHLLATWRNKAARERFAAAMTAAWQARVGDTRPVLHLIPSDDDYDYQEDVVDNGADA